MSVVNDVVEAVIGLMNATTPFASVTRGALPTGAGITCEVAPTMPRLYMDKNTFVPLSLTINGKHANLKTLSDALNDIHSTLTRAVSYPSCTKWEITDIKTSVMPQVIGRESDNSWLMASSLSVEFYQRGD